MSEPRWEIHRVNIERGELFFKKQRESTYFAVICTVFLKELLPFLDAKLTPAHFDEWEKSVLEARAEREREKAKEALNESEAAKDG